MSCENVHTFIHLGVVLPLPQMSKNPRQEEGNASELFFLFILTVTLEMCVDLFFWL